MLNSHWYLLECGNHVNEGNIKMIDSSWVRNNIYTYVVCEEKVCAYISYKVFTSIISWKIFQRSMYLTFHRLISFFSGYDWLPLLSFLSIVSIEKFKDSLGSRFLSIKWIESVIPLISLEIKIVPTTIDIYLNSSASISGIKRTLVSPVVNKSQWITYNKIVMNQLFMQFWRWM